MRGFFQQTLSPGPSIQKGSQSTAVAVLAVSGNFWPENSETQFDPALPAPSSVTVDKTSPGLRVLSWDGKAVDSFSSLCF